MNAFFHRLVPRALAASILWLAGAALLPVLAQSAPPTPDELAARGKAALDAGSTMEALAAYDEAVASAPSRTDLRLQFAEALRTAGFWVRSAEQYREVLKAQPHDVTAMIGYGELLNAQYQFAPSAEHFSRALQVGLDPHDRERVLVGLGSARFGLGDYAGAAQVFEGILKESPRVMTAMAYLALSRRNLGDLEAAEKIWTQFLEIDPDASPARIHRIEIQELRAGIDAARATVQRTPQDADAWAALGRLLRSKPDLPGAEKAYASAERLAPREAAHHFAHGAALRDMGRWKESMESLQQASTDRQWGSLALYNLGYAARKANDPEREKRAWGEVAERYPGDLYAYRRYLAVLKATGALDLELARARQKATDEAKPLLRPILLARLSLALSASGDREGARQASVDALRADPNDVHAQRAARDVFQLDQKAVKSFLESHSSPEPADALLRGALLRAMGREDEAEPELRKAVAGAPDDARALTALAGSLRAEGVDEGVAELLKLARAKEPAYLYGHLDAAMVFNEAGRYDDAAKAAREALRLSPDNPVGHALLGTALKLAGSLEPAARAFQEATALDPMEDMGGSRLMLAKIRGEMGRLEDARDLLRGDAPQDPEEMYRMSWEFVRDRYHDRTFHDQNWLVWKDRFEGRLKTPADALGAIAIMLSSLDDRNTRLRSSEQTARLFFSERTDATEFASTGVALGTSRTVDSRRLAENVGYIAITNFDDPRSQTQIREAVEQMKTADAVILDLRGNPGGADSEVPKVTGMFVKPGTPTGTTISPDGKVTETVPPSGGGPIIPENKPVVVLVDRNTASSAETLAGSLRESHRAVLVGEKTYGKSGVQSPRLLPGGAVVLVVAAEHADLGGEVYTGRGIQPDVKVESVPGKRGDGDEALKKAREIIKRRRDG
ncbi:MAG: S41 family peptidase [Candidatus Polarisedimenticolia bacterium]